MSFLPAYDPTHIVARGIKYVQATISTSVLTLADLAGITAVHMDNAQQVSITVRSNSVNITYDGTTPTTSTGHAISTSVVVYGSKNVNTLKLIRNGGSDVVIDITLEG